MANCTVALYVSILPCDVKVVTERFIPTSVRPSLVFSCMAIRVLPPCVNNVVLVKLLSTLVANTSSFVLRKDSGVARSLCRQLLGPGTARGRVVFISHLDMIVVSMLSLTITFTLASVIDVCR